MAKKLSVSFLWHMHQPYYRDDQTTEIVMPWVFLHAIKDYYDMPWYLEKFSTIKATFNLVPSLLVQLKAYENPDVNDKFLKTLKKPVESLDFEEKVYLIEYCFFSNLQKMITPLPRFFELHLKKTALGSLENAAKSFTAHELLDLEVLFLLSWCGNYLRSHEAKVKALLKQERGFSHEDKIALLEALHQFIPKIIPYYHKLSQSGQIEISTTPFNHPISPLLFDIQNAKRANPTTALPAYEGTFKEDAFLQIEGAFDLYEKIFCEKPKGFWPAEGSVSYEFLEVLSQKGLLWACSDEEILYKSGAFTKEDIYKNNVLHFHEGKINLFFRDKVLSDLIGFSYSGWDEKSAVDDFIARLKEIYTHAKTDCNVSVILDGENAWEHYDDNAISFFHTLYEALGAHEWLSCKTFSEIALEEKLPVNTLRQLTPGSWINGNFNIWIGHKEKNAAWEMLFNAKADFEKEKHKLDALSLEKIKREFLVAQSSDWFWWYGDDHHTDLATTFDALFRTHIMNIYTLLKKKIPPIVLEPIVSAKEVKTGFMKPSTNRITPTLDGKISHFYEWLGCGEADLRHELSSMSMHDFAISKVYYGCDQNHCYVALIGDFEPLFENGVLEMELSNETRIKMPISRTLKTDAHKITFITDEIMEIAIPKALVENGQIRFKLFFGEKLLQLLPLYSKIEFTCLKEMKKNWYI